MTRIALGRAGLLACLLLGGGTPAAAQTGEGILAPAGHLRLHAAPTWHMWNRRFGLREEGELLVEESEPLGWDLENEPLIPFADLETRLRTALADPALDLSLGSARAQISRERTTVTLGAALGVFDWLTIGFSVPLVETRTEIAFDFRPLDGANLGLTPSGATVPTYQARLGSSLAALEARRAAACPTGPGCAALADLVDHYGSFAGALRDAYDAPVFLAAGSDAAAALEQRLAAFRAQAEASAPGVEIPGAPPLAAAPLDESALLDLLTTHPAGPRLIAPLQTNRAPFALGDAEASVAVRLLQGAVRDSAARARFRWLLGAQALVRLPTGMVDDPDVPLDLARSDRQLDVEVGAFADVRWSRLGVQAEMRRSFPSGSTLIRRVARPERVMAPLATRREVRWTPAAYTRIEIAPRWHLTDELAVRAHFLRFSKSADDFAEVGPAPGSVPADVLERETQATLWEVGIGLAYSTLTSWREGRADLPVELRLAVREAIAGSGGATPNGIRLEASGHVFVRLWGARPAPVR